MIDAVSYDKVFYQYSDCDNCGLVLRRISNHRFGSGDYKCPRCNGLAKFKIEGVNKVYGNIIIEWEKQSKTPMEMFTFRDLRELLGKINRSGEWCIGIMEEWK